MGQTVSAFDFQSAGSFEAGRIAWHCDLERHKSDNTQDTVGVLCSDCFAQVWRSETAAKSCCSWNDSDWNGSDDCWGVAEPHLLSPVREREAHLKQRGAWLRD